MIYLELFFGFLKVSCFAFGGAYGAIPLIRDVVLSYGWISDETLTYMIAVSESTPGPIIVNLATYIGNTQGGLLGALVATLGVVLPCFVIIVLITAVMSKFIQNKYVQAVLRGLKPCMIGIVLATGVYMLVNNCLVRENGIAFHWKAILITLILYGVKFLYKKIGKKKMPSITLIVAAAVVGMIVYGIR